MTSDDKPIYGQNGPGDIESIIAEIEADTISAQQRLSRLKGEALDFHNALLDPYQPAKTDPGRVGQAKPPLGPPPARPAQGETDKE